MKLRNVRGTHDLFGDDILKKYNKLIVLFQKS